MRLLFTLLCLTLAALPLHADSLADLKSALTALDSRELIRARVIVASTGDTASEAKQVTPLTLSALVEDGPAGLTITWDRALLETVAAERLARSRDPEQPMPTRTSLDEVKTSTLGDYFNAPALVLRLLDRAELVREEAATHHGQPGRLLHLKLKPQLPAKEKKYIKEFDATAKLWLGADGLPVTWETQLHVKGRAMLVISFETSETSSYQFAQTGRRLVVVRHASDVTSSGAGESSHKKSLVTVELLAP